MVTVTVSNRGRQATTIKRAALVGAAGEWSMGEGPHAAPVRPEIDLLDGGIALVEPGNVARFGFELRQWPRMFPADTPMRPYVIDTHNRRTWGPAAPILRMLLNSGVPPPPGTDPRYLEPPADYEPIAPDPVEPMWKLWKPKWQRRPSKPPRSSRMVPRTPQEDEEREARRRGLGIGGDDAFTRDDSEGQHGT
jgi:hypothetical protein